jgi:Holliday junction resolvasome RuvABC DNA-binding subunit
MNLLDKLSMLDSMRTDLSKETLTDVSLETTICIIKLERELIHELVDLGFSDKEIAKIINNAQIKV